MADKAITTLPQLLQKHHNEILKEWLEMQARTLGDVALNTEIATQSREFVPALQRGAMSGQFENVMTREWTEVRSLLEDVSRAGAMRGLTPTQTATFVFSLKEPVFNMLRREYIKDSETLAHEVWIVTQLLDKLGLYTTEVHQKTREEMIIRQQESLLEL